MNWSELDPYDDLEIISTRQLTDSDIPEGFTIEVVETAKGTFYRPLRHWTAEESPNFQTEALYMDDRLDPCIFLSRGVALRVCQKFAANPGARDELVWSRRTRTSA